MEPLFMEKKKDWAELLAHTALWPNKDLVVEKLKEF